MQPLKPLVLFLAVSLGLNASGACAQGAPSQSVDLSELMARFGAVKSAAAHFTERKYLHMLKAPLGDSGTLVYAAPDKLQKDTLRPNPERLTLDGDTLTIERRGKTQTLSLADYPQVGGFIEGIRATLAGDLAGLQQVYLTHIEGSLDAWRLVLQPRDEKMREIVRSIAISGADVHISRIETVERDNDRTDMTIVEDSP